MTGGVSYEAAEVRRLLDRGVVKDLSEAHELIGVTLDQQKFLERSLGADRARVIVRYRREILREFKQMLENSNHETAA